MPIGFSRRRFWIGLKWALAAAAIWLLLPVAVFFSWPVALWWLARVLSRSAQPWLAALLVVVFGVQIGVLSQRPLGVDVLLFGGTVAFLELWRPSARGWRRFGGDILFGSMFCAAFLAAGSFSWTVLLNQVLLLIGVNSIETGMMVWRRGK